MMATIRREFEVDADAARVWDALRDFGAGALKTCLERAGEGTRAAP
jgi:carbon monoxide dehydrogenase subunit G